MSAGEGVLFSIMNVFSPKEDKDIVDRRKREENMKCTQMKLDELKRGVLYFQTRKDGLIKDMSKARKRGHIYEAENAYVEYQNCDKQLKLLNDMIKNLNGIKISMMGAEYSVGAMDIINQSSDFYANIAQSINPSSIDGNISVVMDQETLIEEMQGQLSAPFSKSSLEYSQKDETLIVDEIDAIIGSSNDNGGPKDKPKTEAMIELPTIPDDVKKQPLKSRKNNKKKKALKTKRLF